MAGDSEVVERLIAAEQDERRRLALFLHDGPVQELAGIALMLDGAVHAIAAGRAAEARTIIESALGRQRETIRELRDLSFVLEPVVLRDQGFVPALSALADRIGDAHGIPVDLVADAASLVDETTRAALYAIIRELLEQSVRRGPPGRITITVAEGGDGAIVATVADDAEPERRRRSLEAIEERVRQLNGRLEVHAGECGTDVRVELPSHTALR
jgi:signal transduction histidine kinase